MQSCCCCSCELPRVVFTSSWNRKLAIWCRKLSFGPEPALMNHNYCHLWPVRHESKSKRHLPRSIELEDFRLSSIDPQVAVTIRWLMIRFSTWTIGIFNANSWKFPRHSLNDMEFIDTSRQLPSRTMSEASKKQLNPNSSDNNQQVVLTTFRFFAFSFATFIHCQWRQNVFHTTAIHRHDIWLQSELDSRLTRHSARLELNCEKSLRTFWVSLWKISNYSQIKPQKSSLWASTSSVEWKIRCFN